MKKYLILIVLTFASAFSYAQWELITPAPTDQNLLSVSFPDAKIGYTVGSGGVILKTTDGGVNWETQSSGTTKTLNAVFFPTPDTGYAVGDSGTILVTYYGGNNWYPVSAGTTSNLTSVYFTSKMVGYAVGTAGTILKTINGGVSWELKQLSSEHFTSVYFTHSNLGYVVGMSGSILHTEDEGETWTNQSSPNPAPVSSIFFTDADNGYCLIDNTEFYCMNFCRMEFLKTTHAGMIWDYHYDTAVSITRLNAIYFTGVKDGYAVGSSDLSDNGVIYKTTDGGISWNPLDIGNVHSLRGIFFTDKYAGYAVGNSGTILMTRSGGVISVKENTASISKSTISPNPARSSVTIANPRFNIENADVSISDCTGLSYLVSQDVRQGEIQLDVSKLKPGIYYIRILHQNTTEISKLVICSD